MKVLSVTGYYGSGSSAINDLFSEYESVGGRKCNFECSVFGGVYGIANLHYYFKRAIGMRAYAVRDYYHTCKYLSKHRTKMNYEKYFDGHFMEYTEEYIRKISGHQIGVSHYDQYYFKLNKVQDTIVRVADKLLDIGNKIYERRHTDTREIRSYLFTPARPRFLYDVSEEMFFQYTKEYLSKLFSIIADGKKFVAVDGFFYRDITEFYDKIVDDKAFIICDRDPRDIYITGKYIFKNGTVPTNNIEDFCNWYRYIHTNLRGCDANYVMRINFEELVWNYEETVKKIEDFIGLESIDHVDKFKYFNPNISSKNTKLWAKYPSEKENINYIENHLEEWLYRY